VAVLLCYKLLTLQLSFRLHSSLQGNPSIVAHHEDGREGEIVSGSDHDSVRLLVPSVDRDLLTASSKLCTVKLEIVGAPTFACVAVN